RDPAQGRRSSGGQNGADPQAVSDRVQAEGSGEQTVVPMKPSKHGGGWAAIKYTWRMANRVGWWRLWKAMRAKNACKTCALGMGGQAGGMRNETAHSPGACKKPLQAIVADLQHGLRPERFPRYSIAHLRPPPPREPDWRRRLV